MSATTIASSPTAGEGTVAGQRALDPRRWWILGVIGLAQLMVVLDATIVNIALPSAQHALGFSDGNRQWIVTAYALAFGSLLLLGGRLSDVVGRRRIFVIGIAGFALASAVGGAAGSFGVLVTARALQGAFGALLAPAALSLLTTTFHDPKERGKAFAVFGGIAGAGGGFGLLLGGLLTEYLSWRWCLYVNLAFAVVAFVGAIVLIPANRPTVRPKLDFVGIATSVAGLFLIVYGFSHADTAGWSAPATVASLVGGVALLAAFVAAETRVAQPLLPMRVLVDRTRGGSNLGVVFSGAGMFGLFLFMTYYLQGTLGFSPVKTGLAFLPFVGSLSVAAALSTTVLMPRFGPKVLIVGGQALSGLAVAGLALSIGVHTSYAPVLLPLLIVMAFGIGMVVAPGLDAGTLGVDTNDAGVASSLVNTSQQIGGSIGTALLNTIAATALSTYIGAHGHSPSSLMHATVHSYVIAFWWSAAIFAFGAAVCGVLMRGGRIELDPDAPRIPGV
jgi:EmrB/QacA subfamily drug resistance transporter